MKTLVFYFFVFLLSLATLAQEKAVEVIYTKAYKNFRDTSDNPPRIMKNLEYRLYCSPVASRFEFIAAMTNDSNKANERFIGKGGGDGVYYKNIATRKKLRQLSNFGGDFLIKENYDKYKWSLKKEKKEILGIECYKAIGSYQEYSQLTKKNNAVTVTVWYAPGIPLPFGPAGYDGLPGLVLESSTASFYFIAQEIKFSDKVKKIKAPAKGKKVTMDEFNKQIYKAFKEITNYKDKEETKKQKK